MILKDVNSPCYLVYIMYIDTKSHGKIAGTPDRHLISPPHFLKISTNGRSYILSEALL